MKSTLIAVLLVPLLLAGYVQAAEFKQGNLIINDPYTRSTPPRAPVAGGFMKITNTGKEDDRLVGGSVGFAAITEVHEMAVIEGVMKMKQLNDGLIIPAGKTVELKPGGYHVMFIKLKQAMKVGESHKGTLTFEKAGDVDVSFAVRNITKMKHGKAGHMSQSSEVSHPSKDEMSHVNPLPNLMKVIVNQGDELKLTDQQKKRFKQWRATNAKKTHEWIQQIIQAEKALRALSLKDEKKAVLLAKYDEIEQMRRQIAELKIECQSNAKKILNKQQYQRLLDLSQ